MQSMDDNSDTFSPVGVRDRGALLHDQVSLHSDSTHSSLRHCTTIDCVHFNSKLKACRGAHLTVCHSRCLQDSMQDSMYGSNPKLEAMDPGPLISDAEIASSIKNTMNMLKTMSLPLSLLKGAPSFDPLGDAMKV